jgi:hypothetical protein
MDRSGECLLTDPTIIALLLVRSNGLLMLLRRNECTDHDQDPGDPGLQLTQLEKRHRLSAILYFIYLLSLMSRASKTKQLLEEEETMFCRLITFPTMLLILAVACSYQSISHDVATPTPMQIQSSPAASIQTAKAPTSTPMFTALPIQSTYSLVVKYNCGMSANGVTEFLAGGVALCFEEPGFFEARGNVDYFLLMVTHNASSARLDTVTYNLLQGIVPTPTPTATTTPGPTPTYLPTLPASILAKTPPGHIPPPPVTVRTITLDVTGYCNKPVSSTSMNHISVCFTVPPGQENQWTIEYWTITVTRDLTPTVKYGTFEWATPAP